MILVLMFSLNPTFSLGFTLGFIGFRASVTDLAAPQTVNSASEHNNHKILEDLSPQNQQIRLMDKILHDSKDPKLWELWYIPYYG